MNIYFLSKQQWS